MINIKFTSINTIIEKKLKIMSYKYKEPINAMANATDLIKSRNDACFISLIFQKNLPSSKDNASVAKSIGIKIEYNWNLEKKIPPRMNGMLIIVIKNVPWIPCKIKLLKTFFFVLALLFKYSVLQELT